MPLTTSSNAGTWQDQQGLHELPCDQPDIVALLAQCTSKKMRSGASLKADERCGHVRGIGQNLAPREFLPHKHLACCSECHEVKGGLAQIDAN